MTHLHHDWEWFCEWDVREYGASRVSRHPSFLPLMCAYAFDDGPVRQWVPAEGQPMPAELLDGLTDPAVLKFSWNKVAEYVTWLNGYGIEVPHREWRDPMVLAFSLSLPGSLDRAGKVVGLAPDTQKMAKGKTLIRTFSLPNRPTRTRPNPRRDHTTDPELWEEFKEYNRQDVVAEVAIWRRLRKWDLPEHEWELWFLDQEINERGMPINLRAVNNAIVVSEELTARRLDRLRQITGLANPNSTQQLLGWLRAGGYPFEDMKKGHVNQALAAAAGDELFHHPDYVEVLRLRQEISKTSIKKYRAYQAATDEDGMFRYGFQFAGAGRTWRWSGRKVQVQNLARPARELEKCQGEAVRHLELLDADMIEWLYKYPYNLLSTCVRPVIQAPDGHLFADADLNAIENRVLGWLAGDRKILSVFADNRDPYVDFATYMFGRPYAELLEEYKAGDKEKRTISKPAVLGCFGAGTLVLTDSGWKRIEDIAGSDLVYDGVEFVSHTGVIDQGTRETLCLSGVYVTPDHEVLTDLGWMPSCRLGRRGRFGRAIRLASGLLSGRPHQADRLDGCIYADAPAALNGTSLGGTCLPGKAPAAPLALSSRVGRISGSAWGRRYTISSRIGSMRSGPDARMVEIRRTRIMAVVESAACLTMHMILCFLRSIFSGLTGLWRSIESTTTGIMLRITCGLPIGAFRTAIAGIAQKSNIEGGYIAQRNFVGYSAHSTVTRERCCANTRRAFLRSRLLRIRRHAGVRTTYDIANAGPRNRFVVLTAAGPLVVHNCGYMLGPGVERENPTTGEIEATGLLGYAWAMGVKLTLMQSIRSVQVWRDTFTDVVEYWYEIDKAARKCIRTGQPTRAGHIRFDRSGPWMRMILPSGRALHYCRPALEQKRTPWGEVRPTITYEGLNDKKQWVRVSTHPGKLVENADQAVSRDLLAHGMMLAHRRGLDIRIHVHDQIVVLSPEYRASKDLEILQDCMRTVPKWAPGLPLGSAGFVSKIFVKD